MSLGAKLPYRQVYPLAQKLIERLAPACARIEIAGSLRRKESHVGDIELVAIPKFERPVMGVTASEHWGWSELDHLLTVWDSDKRIDIVTGGKLRGKERKYTKFLFKSSAGQTYTVDLFIQPDPATWGVNLMIRTGSSDFSRRMVTPKAKGGLKPDDVEVVDALVWRDGAVVPTPEEQDIFELWSLAYVAPEKRR